MSRFPRYILCTVLILVAGALRAGPQSAIDGSIVEVIVTALRPEPRMPWHTSKPVLRVAYGIVVGPGRVVTTEDTVRNASLVEVRRPGQPAKLNASVRKADPCIGVALLDLPANAANAFSPIPWDDVSTRPDNVTLVFPGNAGQLQTGEGRVSECTVTRLNNIPCAALLYNILSDLKIDKPGAPILNGGRLTAIALRYDAASQLTQALPALLLKRFVEDASGPSYKGFATTGIFALPLIDPAKRHYYGLPDNNTGILVQKLTPGTGVSKALAAGDVILRWDGVDVDSQGYYQDPVFGRIAFMHRATLHPPGDTITCTVLRDRKSLDLSLTLDAYNDARALVPVNVEGAPVEYLVEGGLLIRELTGDYVTPADPRIPFFANARLLNISLTRGQFPDKPGDRIVIVTGVLPDTINKAYQQLRDGIVTAVNGQPIASIKDVFAIRRRDGVISRLTISDVGTDIVFDKDALPEANARIAERYRIYKLLFERQ